MEVKVALPVVEKHLAEAIMTKRMVAECLPGAETDPEEGMVFR